MADIHGTILLRFRDLIGEVGDTIAEHKKILKGFG